MSNMHQIFNYGIKISVGVDTIYHAHNCVISVDFYR